MDEESDYIKYRGKCYEMCMNLILDDPTLTMVRGHYYCPIWNTDEQHWWCVKPNGEIVDPTKLQFRSKGNGIYTPFNGMVSCEYCGKELPEVDAYFVDHHVYCSYEHYGRDIGF